MSRLVTQFADSKPETIASKSAMRRSRQIFFTITWAIALLLIVDAAGFDGRYRRTAWYEAQTGAHLLNHNLSRILAGLAR
jgi:hypothetical protein